MEAGYTCEAVELIGGFDPTPALFGDRAFACLARDVRPIERAASLTGRWIDPRTFVDAIDHHVHQLGVQPQR